MRDPGHKQADRRVSHHRDQHLFGAAIICCEAGLHGEGAAPMRLARQGKCGGAEGGRTSANLAPLPNKRSATGCGNRQASQCRPQLAAMLYLHSCLKSALCARAPDLDDGVALQRRWGGQRLLVRGVNLGRPLLDRGLQKRQPPRLDQATVAQLLNMLQLWLQ